MRFGKTHAHYDQAEEGLTDFVVPFPYLHGVDIKAELDDSTVEFQWVNSSTIRLDPAPSVGQHLHIYRKTNRDNLLVKFQGSSTLTAADLTLSVKQSFYIAQEVADEAEIAYHEAQLALDLSEEAGEVAAEALATIKEAVKKAEEAVKKAEEAAQKAEEAAKKAEETAEEAAKETADKLAKIFEEEVKKAEEAAKEAEEAAKETADKLTKIFEEEVKKAQEAARKAEEAAKKAQDIVNALQFPNPVGQPNKLLAVNEAGDAMEFVDTAKEALQATEEKPGFARIATKAEVEEGASASSIVTPAMLSR